MMVNKLYFGECRVVEGNKMTLITCSNGAVIDYALANAVSLGEVSQEQILQGHSRLKASQGYLDDPEIVALVKKDAKERKLLEGAVRNLELALYRITKYAEKDEVAKLVADYLKG